MTTRDPRRRYRAARATVIENAHHGPHLCFSILTSLPPQGSGIPLVGWSWSTVAGVQTLRGTTWAIASVIGTFNGGAFQVEAVGPPDASEPFRANRPSVASAEEVDLADLQSQVLAAAEESPFGGVYSSQLDEASGLVVVDVGIADDVSQAWARARWGDRVVLNGAMQPIV